MLRVAVLLVATTVSACSSVERFEDGLVGAQLVAYNLCKAEYGEAIETPPAIVKESADHFLFVWADEDLEEMGGLDTCETNIDGTEIIELRIRGAPLG